MEHGHREERSVNGRMEILPTRHGLRLRQHGVVVSEMRTAPGPTHSVFDVLAAAIAVLRPEGRVGLLGFAGGGMMAPLRCLEVKSTIDAVDLDRSGYDLFRQHCPDWISQVRWQQDDALAWLREQPGNFDLLMDDLSVPINGDVTKPSITWNELPSLMRDRLKPGGIAVFNLLLPPCGSWPSDLTRIAGLFATARLIDMNEFENRILIAGDHLPSARALGRSLREALRRLRSRQAGRIHVHSSRAARIEK